MTQRNIEANKSKVMELPICGEKYLMNLVRSKIDFQPAVCDFLHFGVSKGDTVVVQVTSELNEHLLTAFVDKKKSGRLGYGFDNFGDISIFDGDKVHRYKKGEMSVFGVVIGVVKPYSHTSPFLDEPEETDEITVVCGGCQTTSTGTPEFLKSMGWNLRCKPICLKCYFL